MVLAKWMRMAGAALVLAVPAGVLAADGAGSPLDAPGARSQQPRPRIEVDEPEKNAGEVQPGAHAVFAFAIRNTGQMPLEIRSVKPDCGCVVADFDRTIPPGGTGSVRATINTTGRKGELTKHLRVESNDPERPALSLTLQARVFEPISIFPSDQILLPLMPNRLAAVEAVVRCNEAEPLEIRKVESSNPALRARLLPIAGGGGANRQPDHRIELLVPKKVVPTAFTAMVTLHTNRPNRPTLQLHVVGYPHTSVAANPPRLYFGEIAPGDPLPIKRTITLFRREGPFKVLSTTASDPALTVTVESGPERDFSDVRVAYTGGWKPGPVAGTITLRTDDPARPVIEVPFEALVGE
jgi:hypothetical protein